jgi:hypothetical protein
MTMLDNARFSTMKMRIACQELQIEDADSELRMTREAADRYNKNIAYQDV